MKALLTAAALFMTTGLGLADDKEKKVTGPLDHKINAIDGKELDLSKFKGKVVLFVNVASECGFTPQYKGLQELHDKYEKDGLVVIGVPSNDFGKQEPGSNAEILKFCQTNYKVKFVMAEKVAVSGDKKVPLYQFLTSKETNPKFEGEVKWNFEKFLIGRNGEVVGRFKSSVEPMSEQLTKAIKAELDAK
jgi:glutathione peroxidase